MVITKITTHAKAIEMLRFIDTNGEHALVREYKGKVTDEDISGIIGAWACSVKPIDWIANDYFNRHKKIYKLN